MPIKALIRLAFVCLITAMIAKPHPAPINNSGKTHQQVAVKQTKVEAKSEPKVTAKAKPEVEKQQATPKQEERPEPVTTPVQALPTDKTDLMRLAGIPESDWEATDYIVSKESSWNPTAQNSSSGAYGLCQALPASKMASVGGDYLTNPVTQLKWCHEYSLQRYGGWWSAFAFWRSNAWW